MGTSQTSTQNDKDFVMGAAKVEYLYLGSFLDAGIGRDISFNVEGTPLDVQVDNASKPSRLKGLASQVGNMSFTLMARNLQLIYRLRGGVDVYTATAATPVTGKVQVVEAGKWGFLVPIECQYISTVKPTITISGDVDGALVEDTDFIIQKVSDNVYSVVILDSVDVTTEDQELTLTVDYTPIASEKLSTGGLVQQEDQTLRLTNKTPDIADQADVDANPSLGISVGDGIYRVRRITAYAGTVTNGLQYSFLDKDSTDPVVVAPIEMLFEQDPDRPIGDQLTGEENYIIKQ